MGSPTWGSGPPRRTDPLMEPTAISTSRPPRRRRAGLLLGLTLALVATPAIVLASHQFGDVPTSSPFHGNIASLVETGITAGCGNGNYCPKSAVTREQMAAFLTRGLGDAASSYSEIALENWATSYVNAVTISAGGTSGGTGFITVIGDVSVLVADPALCPCGVEIGIDQLDAPGTSPQTIFVVPADAVDSVQANAGTIRWVFEVPSGANAEFGLYANVFPAAGGTVPVAAGTLLGTLTAEYSPFGSTTVFEVADAGTDGPRRFAERGARIQERTVPR